MAAPNTGTASAIIQNIIHPYDAVRSSARSVGHRHRINSTSALCSFHCLAHVFLRPLATSSINRNSSQPTSSMVEITRAATRPILHLAIAVARQHQQLGRAETVKPEGVDDRIFRSEAAPAGGGGKRHTRVVAGCLHTRRAAIAA